MRNTPQRTVATVSLLYKGHTYVFESDFGHDYPAESAHYMFKEGNYACDCNRSLFIQRAGNPDFNELGCGHKIELVGFEVLSKP